MDANKELIEIMNELVAISADLNSLRQRVEALATKTAVVIAEVQKAD